MQPRGGCKRHLVGAGVRGGGEGAGAATGVLQGGAGGGGSGESGASAAAGGRSRRHLLTAGAGGMAGVLSLASSLHTNKSPGQCTPSAEARLRSEGAREGLQMATSSQCVHHCRPGRQISSTTPAPTDQHNNTNCRVLSLTSLPCCAACSPIATRRPARPTIRNGPTYPARQGIAAWRN